MTVSGGLTLDNSTLRLNHSTNSGNFDQYVQLNFAGGVQTLGGTGTVELVNNRNDGYSEHVRLRPTAGGDLTIGAGITIKNLASTYFSVIGDAGLPLLIEGTIISQSTQSSNYSLQVTGSSVTNSGTLQVDTAELDVNGLSGNLGNVVINGGDLDLDGTYTVSDLVTVPDGGSLTLRGDWNNASTIDQTTGSTVYLGSTFTVADLGTFTGDGGSAVIFGTLEDDGVGCRRHTDHRCRPKLVPVRRDGAGDVDRR